MAAHREGRLMIKMHGGRRVIALTISADQSALYNIYTAATAASGGVPPTDVVDVTLTVNSGIACKAGMTTGAGWALGSTITIINNGTIAGLAGGVAVGNNGFGWGASAAAARFQDGSDGAAGGNALTLTISVTIDNTSGLIAGGGGQGGGGGASAASSPPGADHNGAGGGGGAGQGYTDTSANTPPKGGYPGDQDGGTPPAAGSDGSSAGPGAGGPGGSYFPFETGGTGGPGGAWGQPGSSGSAASGGSFSKNPGNGGAAGKAVALSGFSVTWLGGNDATHVKGAVS